VGVSPLQLVNLHRNRKYFVIKLHTWFCLSYVLKTNIQFYCIYQYFMSIKFFQHRICFSIQPPDYSDPWPRLARSTSFFLIMLFNHDHSVEGDLANANSEKNVLYFFLLMLYKTSTCKIFWLCAVVFFTTFIHWRQFFVFCVFFLSICKSNIPLTSVIMNLK
jgi:hypothetical protein